VTRLRRRDFLKGAGLALAGPAFALDVKDTSRHMDRPNIVFIITDQQNSRMVGCAGNPYLKTPAMDSLAAGGVRFERAYCTNPVCVPSRFSLLTGRMPSAIGQRANPSRHLDPIPEAFKRQGIGWLLRAAGYETSYGGKVHLPKGLTPEDLGFETLTRDERDGLTDTCADYLRRAHDRPFALVASFINPHDICYMAIRDFATSNLDHLLVSKGETELSNLDAALERPPGAGEEQFFQSQCPPLPPNFEPQENEPEAIRIMVEQRAFKKKAREQWPGRRWREHRWAYCRLTEMVDAQIGRLLDALRESGLDRDTLVVFSSDHGDHDSAHRLEHKSTPYEEASCIPFIIRPPGGLPGPMVDDTHLVSNGLDLVPTLCDYAGTDAPADLEGRSLRPIVEGARPRDWRDFVPVEGEFACMVRTDRYKYALYDEGENREQLYDLREDPHETRNAAGDAGKGPVLEEHRRLLQRVRGRVS